MFKGSCKSLATKIGSTDKVERLEIFFFFILIFSCLFALMDSLPTDCYLCLLLNGFPRRFLGEQTDAHRLIVIRVNIVSGNFKLGRLFAPYKRRRH